MYKNYFFDLYGTLVDIWTDEKQASLWRGMAEFYSLCGASYSPEELRERYLALCAEETEILAEASPELGTDGVEIELRHVFRRLFEEKGIAVSDTQVDDTALMFRVLSFCRAPSLMKGAKRTLQGLRERGARLYLLSNAQSCFTVPELRCLCLLDGVFDGIFLSSDFGVKKPAAAFFNAALERACLSASEVLMVGNDPVADIRGAVSVGMESRYIHTCQSPPRGMSLPESCKEIASLEDLLEEGIDEHFEGMTGSSAGVSDNMKTIKVVAAVIRDGDRIFATQRGHGDWKDYWEFPGGKIEPGETSEDALRREIREELDAEIAVGEKITTIEYDYPEFHLSMDCFTAAVTEGSLVLKEHEAARWLKKDDLDSVRWLPADKTIIELLKQSYFEEDDNYER